MEAGRLSFFRFFFFGLSHPDLHIKSKVSDMIRRNMLPLLKYQCIIVHLLKLMKQGLLRKWSSTLAASLMAYGSRCKGKYIIGRGGRAIWKASSHHSSIFRCRPVSALHPLSS